MGLEDASENRERKRTRARYKVKGPKDANWLGSRLIFCFRTLPPISHHPPLSRSPWTCPSCCQLSWRDDGGTSVSLAWVTRPYFLCPWMLTFPLSNLVLFSLYFAHFHLPHTSFTHLLSSSPHLSQSSQTCRLYLHESFCISLVIFYPQRVGGGMI